MSAKSEQNTRTSESDFPGLDSITVDGHSKSLDVCILTPDILGPIRNGGIGTAYSYVADALVADGHQVTILYVHGRHVETGDFDQFVTAYKERGISLVPLPELRVNMPKGPRKQAVLSYTAYEWLKDKNFDLIHVSEWRGTGYYCLLAKRLGMAFQNTLICVKASSPMLWNLIGNSEPITDLNQLVTIHIERKCIELADIVISGSKYMLRWMAEHNYNLPRPRVFFQPNIMPAVDIPTNMTSNEVNELVFFGRLEPRKGIHIFCDAIDELASQHKSGNVTETSGLKITFLGKEAKSHFNSREYIENYSKEWPFEIKVVSNLGQPQALEYLRQSGRLAVMPSVIDNSPFGVYECLAECIPFIAANTGGIPELINSSDHAEVLFELHPIPLRKHILRVLKNGVRIASPSFDFKDNLKIWSRFHNNVLDLKTSMRPEKESRKIEEEKPLVSVCVAHYNRPLLLKQALLSLEMQDYPNYEVIVVDDGSTNPDVVKQLGELEQKYSHKGWKFIRQENRYLGAVRNTGAQIAKGRYLLFMDDDNVAKPNEISRFVRAAEYSKADILTCFSDEFSGKEMPSVATPIERRVTPVGDNLALGLFFNGFGDSNALVRKSVYDALGGFTEDYKVGKDDQEFFARACLKDYSLLVVPESLFWYRQSDLRLRDTHYNQYAGSLRVARPYISTAPRKFQELFLFAQGLRLASVGGGANHGQIQEIEELAGQLERYQKLFSIGFKLFHLQSRLFDLVIKAEIKIVKILMSLFGWLKKK